MTQAETCGIPSYSKQIKQLKFSHLYIILKKTYFLGYLFWLRVLRDEKENYFNLN